MKEKDEEVARRIEKLKESMFREPEKDTTMEVLTMKGVTKQSELGDDQEYQIRDSIVRNTRGNRKYRTI